MSAASQPTRLRADDFVRERSMYAWSAEDIEKIAEIFGVTRENVTNIPHPIDHDASAIALTFNRGGNVAAALASYLNHEFYGVGPDLAAEFVYREPNRYSFIQNTRSGDVLILTVPYDVREFILGLEKHRSELHFVALHPEILFMMRPRMAYDAAKSSLLKSAYQPSI